ncbi:O-antigen ligase family protein [Microbacterium sp. NPDC055455]
MTACLVLTAIAWAVATRGATDLRDLAVLLALLVAAVVVARAWPRRDPALWTAIGAVIVWLIANGPLRTGWSLESVRVPILVVLVTLTVIVVGRMRSSEREMLLAGLVVVGSLQAAIALVSWAVLAAGSASGPARAEGLLGFPNGLGILLVATSIVALREIERRRGGRLLPAALLLQVAAILATGSRTAILIGAIVVCAWLALRTARWRAGAGRSAVGSARARHVLVVSTLGVGTAVVLWRTAVEPNEDRPHLWLEALQRIAAAPITGEGAPAAAFRIASPASRVTTSAHNEILQWTLEYGLVGLGLAVAVIVLALRSSRPWRLGDRWLQVAALALLASGLTGFSPRISAVALAAAVFIGLSAARAEQAPDQAPVSQTVVSGGSSSPSK